MYCTHCRRELEEVARYCSVCGTARHPVDPVEDTRRERRTLSRPCEGGKIAGVCAGFARYFDMDVTLVRILWIVAAICPPLPGLIAYVICWIIMPKDPCPTPSAPNAAGATSQTSHA
jgi:phage shock protein C